MVECRPRVLVADDEEDPRSMVSEFLSESGYEVLVAANGLASLLHVKRARPSVGLLDPNMPRLGGSAPSSELARETLSRGAVDFVAKPIDLAYLGRTVDTAMTLKHLGT